MKKFLSIMILSSLLSGFYVNEVYASEYCSHINNVEKIDDLQIRPTSLTGLPAPMDGAKLIGKSYKSSWGNLSTVSDAASLLAKIVGVDINDSIKRSASILVKALNYTGWGNVYYIRYDYQSADGWYFYYRYDYYTDSSYTTKVGSDYSYVFGRYAR